MINLRFDHGSQYKEQALTEIIPILTTSWQPVLRYGESVFTKESQGIEFFVVVALDYYENSGQLLNYVYIDICPRCRLHRICAFKKGQNSLSHERYSLKYASSDKTNAL